MRIRATILVKLLVALVIPTVALFTLFAVVAFEVSRRDLDDELGQRLETLAASAATQVRGKYLDKLRAGDENVIDYQNAMKRLRTLAAATGARFIVFDRDFLARVDTSTGEDRLALRAHDYRAKLDREELTAVFERRETASSVTFVGNDDKWYKAGYAPIRTDDDDPTAVLAVSAQAPASYFARLDDLRSRLFLWGAGLVLVSILAAVIATLLITRNVRRLASAAERIGTGELRAKVRIASNDELGQLAQSMDRMREQLLERDVRMQQMLAGIAHEVRNPLAGMTLFAGILRDELPDGDERRSHVERIQRELGYLERVVNEFLEFARRAKPELADVEVAELLAEIAQLVTSDAIEVAVAPAGDTVARADRGQLRRALINLAKNAVQAATAAGHRGKDAVRLSAAVEGDELHLVVWNRGQEISPETSGKLFEPFFTTREKGTGLGLAFVREIAHDHGGRVELHSADGQTTFTLVLPISV
ncbi:MAG: HAMP domain-containing histidine kinase [Deltaproteobacteria bacterium]|nr:HAMP domain-containing histidine kinase [Deltaproteobacteria bacterium]